MPRDAFTVSSEFEPRALQTKRSIGNLGLLREKRGIRLEIRNVCIGGKEALAILSDSLAPSFGGMGRLAGFEYCRNALARIGDCSARSQQANPVTVRPERQGRAALHVVALLIVAALIVSAVFLGFSVSRGTSQTFDERVLLLLRVPGEPMTPIGPVWLTEVARDVTALGGVAVLTLLSCLATIHLLLRREWGAAVLVAVAAISGTMISNVLKDVFARPRPELTAIAEYGVGSFPSGHSTASAVIYLTLGLLLAHAAEQQSIKVFYVLTAILLTTLVGLSRLYLGVHYPTDVMAGWAIGSAWALSCSLVATAIGSRKHPRSA